MQQTSAMQQKAVSLSSRLRGEFRRSTNLQSNVVQNGVQATHADHSQSFNEAESLKHVRLDRQNVVGRGSRKSFDQNSDEALHRRSFRRDVAVNLHETVADFHPQKDRCLALVDTVQASIALSLIARWQRWQILREIEQQLEAFAWLQPCELVDDSVELLSSPR